MFFMNKKIAEKIRHDVKEVYELIADEFDVTRKTEWPEFKDFLKYIGNKTKVLDLGCGNGRFYDLLKSKKIDYLGIDNSSSMINRAKMNFPDAEFRLGDMVDLDLPNNSFDVVLSIASLHHIPSKHLRRKTASEMNRVLKKGGVLILTVWNLFQIKYLPYFFKSIISFFLHLGFKYGWNDLWLRWGNNPLKRYYHAFLPFELLRYFKNNNWKIEEFYFVRKGFRVKFWHSYNICLIARKIKI